MSQEIIPAQVEEELHELFIRSPMFNLSLSSMELFHSNLIHWLINSYGFDLVALLFGTELTGTTRQPVISVREKGNIDLTVSIGETRRLYVENKFKSLPSSKQLTDYYDKKQKECQDRTCHFVLLTLDAEVTSVDTRWVAITYTRVLAGLEKAIKDGVINEKYHIDLINDYMHYVGSMSSLLGQLTPYWASTNDFLEHKKDGYYAIFQKHRLHDLYDKRRYAFLADKVRLKLEACIKKDTVRVSSGFSHSTGLTDTWIRMPKHQGMSMAIQIQGSSLRKMYEHTPKGKDDPWTSQEVHISIDPVLEILPILESKGWFSFDQAKHSGVVYPKSSKGKYNHYGQYMQYRRVELEPYSLDELVRLITEMALKGISIAQSEFQ